VGLHHSDLRISEDARSDAEQSLHPWTAPELLEDHTLSPNTASDIFSLGAIVATLITLIQERNPSRKLPLLTSIARQCTSADPSARPTLSDLIKQLEAPDSNSQATDLLAPMPTIDNVTELTGLQNVDRWRVVPYVSRIHAEYSEHDDRLYLASAPLEGFSEHPLRQLCIEVKCHDQGRENTSARQADGTWTWIELALLRESEPHGKRTQVNLKDALKGQPRGFMIEDTRYEIIRLPFADSTPRVHRVNLDWRTPFIKEARRGDVIALHPKARFPGWMNCMYSAEMHVVTEQ